jgi:hypothetical protein
MRMFEFPKYVLEELLFRWDNLLTSKERKIKEEYLKCRETLKKIGSLPLPSSPVKKMKYREEVQRLWIEYDNHRESLDINMMYYRPDRLERLFSRKISSLAPAVILMRDYDED